MFFVVHSIHEFLVTDDAEHNEKEHGIAHQSALIKY